MENSKIANIKKASSVTAKVLNVIKVILIVGLVMCIVGGISVMCIRSKDGNTIEIFGKTVTVHSGVDIGNMEVDGFDFINDLDIEDPFVKAGVNCFCAAILCALAIAAVVVIRSAFTEIENSDTPFKPEIMKKVKIAGILVTIITLSESVGTAAIVGLSFWCIYCIFDYGLELQKCADETL